MPKDPNRITVDLQLLRTRELEKLEAFGRQFETAIESLKAAMGGYSSQIGYAQQMTGFGRTAAGGTKGVSPGASVASTGVGGGAGHEGSPPGGRSRFASVAGNFGIDLSGYNYAFAGPNINDYERGYFTVGNLANMSAVDILRYLSHVSGEAAGIQRGPDGQLTASHRLLGQFSNAVGGTARALNYGQSVNKVIQRLANTGRSVTSFGQGLGMSSQNVLGIPFTSPASRYTLERGFMAGKSSWFGLNPFYSSAQAKEAQGLSAQYGFVGDQADTFASRLKSLYEDRGLDQNVSAGMLNSAYRQGGFTAVDALTSSLYNLRDAAAVAHMNTAQFATDLQSLAQTLQQQGLSSTPVASIAGQAYASGTYLSPAAYANAAQNQTLTFMQMGRFHEDYFQATHGPHQASQKLGVQMSVIEGMAGMPMSQWGALRQRNPKAFNDMMSRLQIGMQANPLTQGLTINDVIKMAFGRHGGTGAVAAARLNEDLNIATTLDSSGKLTTSFMARLRNEASRSGVSASDLASLNGKSLHDQLSALQKLEQNARNYTDKQGERLSIGLAPGLEKYFKIIYDKAHTNTIPNYDNPSSAAYRVMHRRT